MQKNQNILLSYLQSQFSLDYETAVRCSSLFSFCEYVQDTQIIRMGETENSMQLILNGLVRAYYINENGIEVTKCFAKENEWCGFYSYISDEPSPFFVETLEPSITAKIKNADIKKLSSTSSEIQEKVSELINEAFLKVDKKAYDFANKEASERYLEFVKENPEIIHRIKQEHIASYLGITPSSLSRIKRELNQKITS